MVISSLRTSIMLTFQFHWELLESVLVSLAESYVDKHKQNSKKLLIFKKFFSEKIYGNLVDYCTIYRYYI